MKRIITLLLMIFMTIGLYTTAFADEILFNGVQWGINPYQLKTEMPLADRFIVVGPIERENMPYPSKTAERLLDHSKNVMWYNPEFFSEHSVSYASGGVFSFSSNKPKVAGYDLSSVTMFFSYDFADGEIFYDEKLSHFCCAEYGFDVIDGDNTYGVLVEKLERLYGEGEVQTGENSGTIWSDKAYKYTNHVKICRFNGDNGTHAELECIKTVFDDEDPLFTITLLYWKDEYEAQMKEMDELLTARELENKINNEKNNDMSDLNGL